MTAVVRHRERGRPRLDLGDVDGCACVPDGDAVCLFHWDRLTKPERRKIADRLEFRITRYMSL